MITWVCLTLFLLLAVPLAVYLCVRMGTYGYLRAHEAFRRKSRKTKGAPRQTPWDQEFHNDN